MFINYEKTEAILTQELNFRYFYHWILRKRAILFGILFCGPADIVYSFIKGEDLSFYQYLGMLFNPFLCFSFATLLIYFAEKYFTKNFSSLKEKMKFRRLRIIWLLQNWIFISAIIAAGKLSNYARNSFIYGSIMDNFLVIPAITLFLILIFSYFQFNSLKLEIRSKGLFDKLNIENSLGGSL